MANSQHVEDEPKQVNIPTDIAVTSCPHPVTLGPMISPVEEAAVPSFAAASELLSAPYSCLVLNTHRRHIALPPLHIHKKKTGIKQELDAELLKFSSSLNGVPLAYDNISVIGKQGDIFDDSGYIHLNIEANFIVFQPKKGQTLLGKVNKLGVNHVGCLVHGCFNASIPKPNRVCMETWRDAGPQIGSEFEFTVTALDADTAGVLLIRGQLSRTRVQELLAIGDSMTSTEQQNEPDLDQALGDNVEQNVEQNVEPTAESMDTTTSEETPKKKKKKKKDKIKEEFAFTPEKDSTLQQNGVQSETLDRSSSGSLEKKKKKKKTEIKEEDSEVPVTTFLNHEQDFTVNTTAELNETVNKANGKKKKKKDKRIKEEQEEIEFPPMEEPGGDFSEYLGDKPNKKRKLEMLETDFEMLSKKKIKTLFEPKQE